MVSRTLKAVTLSDLAEWSGIPYDSLHSYRLGRRSAPPATIRKIAAALRKRARKLGEMADRLDAAVERHT